MAVPGLMAVLGLMAACQKEPASSPEPALSQPFESPATPVAPDAKAASGPMPDAGEVQVQIGPAGIALVANDAPFSAILDALASSADFELGEVPTEFENRRLTARIEETALTRVLSLVLREVDYRVGYRFEPASQEHRIATLRIGPERIAEEEPPAGSRFYELLDHPEAAVVLAAIESLRAAGDPMAIPEIEPLLDDDVPEIREAALTALDALEAFE